MCPAFSVHDDMEGGEMKERYLAAMDFPSYLESVEENRELWREIYHRVRIEPELLDEAHRIGGPWQLLALSEDWCSDAVNLLPVVARLAEEVSSFDLRVLSRDENLDLMDAHLTNGRSRSIPIVLLLDENFVEHGWWGPRPRPIQEWFVQEGQEIPRVERSKTIRRYYAQDKGRTMLRELLDLMEIAA